MSQIQEIKNSLNLSRSVLSDADFVFMKLDEVVMNEANIALCRNYIETARMVIKHLRDFLDDIAKPQEDENG